MVVSSLFPARFYIYFLRRRFVVLKIILLVCLIWLTVAALLFMEDRNRSGVVIESIDNLNNLDSRQSIKNVDDNDNLIPAAQQLVAETSLAETPDKNADKMVLHAPGDKGEFDEDKNKMQYGEWGKPVILPQNLSSDIKKLVEEGWQRNAFNQYVSDLISVKRKLPDPRDEW